MQLSHEAERRWVLVLMQLEHTRIAAVQAPPRIEHHVSPRPA